MKKFTLLFTLFVWMTWQGYAQVPNAFNYQVTIRNSSGELIADQDVSFRISVLENSESGTSVYAESHAAHTNLFGLVSLQIGTGNVLDGVFDPGNWGTTSHFLQIEIDPEGGNSFVLMGTSQLLAVPYAFHAKTVEVDNVNDADADATNEIQTLSISGTQLSLSNGGGTVTLPSSGGTIGDNWGTQSVVSNSTLSGNGTTASPLSVIGDLSDNQTLSLLGNELSISGGNSVSVPLSPWIDGTEVYYRGNKDLAIGESTLSLKTKSGEIQSPPKLLIETEDKMSLKLYNNSLNQPGLFVDNNSGQAVTISGNSATLPAAFFGNNGTGPSAWFSNKIKIVDGTQGTGKVLTSDANGLASWQTLTSATSLWTEVGDHISYSQGNVAIGSSSPVDGIKLRVEGSTDQIAVRAANNSSIYGAIYAINSGSGPSALFASPIKIQDGTQGDGKVLTSDGSGNASWQTTFQPIAYGMIYTDGSIRSGSGNISVTNPSTGRYEITISGVSYSYLEHTCTITLSGIIGFGRASSNLNKLVVLTYDKDGTASDASFNFVVY